MPKIFGSLAVMTRPSEDALQRLAEYVERRRRDELDLRQDQLPHGPSTTTMTQIENAEPVSRLSYKRLEKSLRWEAGSVDAILAGKPPLVAGVIRGSGGRPLETFRALDGFEQYTLQRLRLASIIMDARDLVQSQPGPLMTALTAILDEASDLVVKVLAGEDGDIADTSSRIDQVRAGNSIRRVGNIYVADDGESPRGQAFSASQKAEAEEPEEDTPPLSLADAARTAPPGYVSPGRAIRDEQDKAGEESQDEQGGV